MVTADRQEKVHRIALAEAFRRYYQDHGRTQQWLEWLGKPEVDTSKSVK
jgi:hypothetical protein